MNFLLFMLFMLTYIDENVSILCWFNNFNCQGIGSTVKPYDGNPSRTNCADNLSVSYCVNCVNGDNHGVSYFESPSYTSCLCLFQANSCPCMVSLLNVIAPHTGPIC